MAQKLADYDRFQRLIVNAHQGCGWTFRELAELTERHHTYIWEIVCGRKHTIPSRDTLIVLSHYGWSLDLHDTNEILLVGGYKPLSGSVQPTNSLLSRPPR